VRILALDPGTFETGWLILEDGKPTTFGKDLNAHVKQSIAMIAPDIVAVEHFQSFGMPVGKEVFETCYFIGELREVVFSKTKADWVKVTRKMVTNHHCNSSKAKDANIRQAMLDRFGPQGTKKAPGATYGISKDMWSALAIAAFAWDTHKEVA
jgi:hypothetical protein